MNLSTITIAAHSRWLGFGKGIKPMAVYKRDGHWWFTKTINKKRIRMPLPTARTKAQAEEAERKELERMHNQKYGKAQSATPMID